MKWIIITGLSGAGKTVALRALEDMGAYCIDNLPVGLLPDMVQQIQPVINLYCAIGVGIDARNIGLQNISHLLAQLKKQAICYKIIYLTADDSTLTQRFSETRRKHPLSNQQRALSEAIQQEKHLLQPLATQADLHIDTSKLNLYDLRQLIHARVSVCQADNRTLVIQSFGFKYGVPADADFVFDVRCLPNPHWQAQLRPLTGKDLPVIAFFQQHAQVADMLQSLINFLQQWLLQFKHDNRHYLTVAVGCTGGHHRSVYFAEQLFAHFEYFYPQVLLRHRQLPH